MSAGILEAVHKYAKFWPAPNYKNPESKAEMLLGWEIPLMFVTLTVVTFRIYAKARTKLGLGLDDWLICAAATFSISMSVAHCISTNYGWGLHIWDFIGHMNWLSPARKITFITELLFLPTVFLNKLSILVFYHRLFPATSTRLHMFIYIGIAYSILACISNLFAAVFQCLPVEAFWDFHMKGHCIQGYPAQLSTAVLNSVADFYIVLLPMPELWRMTLPRRTKLGLVGLFGLGATVCAAGCVRIYYTTRVYKGAYDFTWEGAYLYIAIAVESNLGIIMASLPALKTLITRSDTPYAYRARSLKLDEEFELNFTSSDSESGSRKESESEIRKESI